MSVNLMTEAQGKINERFRLKSVTEGIFSNEYKWNGVKSIEVYTATAYDLVSYDRGDADGTASRFGTLHEVEDTKQTCEITQDKAFNLSIDSGNAVQQKHIKKAAEIMKMQVEEKYIPLVDKYRLGVLATGAGNVAYSQSFSKSTIVDGLMTARAAMGNNNVPMGNDVVFIGETEAIKLKLADQVISIESVGEKPLVNGVLGKIAGMQIRVVPDSYMPANVLFMVVHKGCAWAPEQLRTLRLLNEHPDVDGVVLQGRFIYDCFVNTTKNKGIYVATSAAQT